MAKSVRKPFPQHPFRFFAWILGVFLFTLIISPGLYAESLSGVGSSHTQGSQTSNCGPRVLQRALERFQIEASLDEMLTLSKTYHGETSLANLIAATRAKGITARGVSMSLADLKRAAPSLSLILYLEPSRHYVLVESLTERGIRIFDPAAAHSDSEMPWELLQRRWKGKAIVIGRGSLKSKFCRLDWRTLKVSHGGVDCDNCFLDGGVQTEGQTTRERTKDPVQLANGNLSLSFQDVLIPSRGDIDLELSRSYNAQLFSELSDWSPESGTGSWSIEQGQYSGQGDRSVSTQGFADFTLELDVQTITAGSNAYDTAWINFRYSDEDSRYYCLIHKTGEVELAKVQDGIASFIAKTSNTAFNPNLWNSIQVIAYGSRIAVFVNNSLQIDYTDPSVIPSGKIALESHFSHAHFDNITVTSDTGTYLQTFNRIDNDFLLGNNWTSSYDYHLFPEPDGSALVLHPDGRKDHFLNVDGSYVAPLLVYDTLTSIASGWNLRTKHGILYTFNTDGELISITDRSGNTTTLTYTFKSATAPAYLEPPTQIIIDDFANATANLNALGRWSDDDATLTTDLDTGGVHKLTWNNLGDYWYSVVETTAKLDASAYQSLSFRVKGAVGGEVFSVELQDGTTTAGVPISSYTTMTTSYKTVTIPLSAWDSQGIDLSSLKAISLAFNASSSGTIYLDDLKLTDPAPVNPPVSYSVRRPTTITDPSGRKLTLTYATNGKLSKVTDPLNRATTYTYNSLRNLTQVKDPKGVIRKYAYTPSRTLSSYTDRKGNLFKFTYFYNNRAATQQDPLGNTTTFDYQWDIVVVANKANERTTTHFDPSTFRLLSLTDALNQMESYAYDANQHLSATTNKRNLTTATTYDAKGNLLAETDPEGHTTSYTFEPLFNQVASITDSLNRTTTFTYDAKGNLLQTADAAGHITAFTYDSFGNRLTITDPLGNVTTFTYDSYGNVLTIKDALNNVTTHTYDLGGRRLSTTDARGNKTSFAYDATNNLTAVTDALGNVTTFTYDKNANLIQKTEPGSVITTYAYDKLNNLTSITDPLGNVTTTTYDATDFLHKGITERIKVTDPLGRSTQYTYDADNRLITTTDANGKTIQYTYDGLGNITTITDQKGNATTYTYDVNNQRTRITHPDNSTFGFDYDEVGNLRSTTDQRGILILYTHDSLNRLITKTYPDGTTSNFTYDALDRLLSASNPTGAITHTYDTLGRLISLVTSFELQYAYDAVGNRATLTYPNGGVVQYTHDALNRLISMTDLNTQPINFTYDSLSRRTSLSLPNGLSSSYAYDAASQLTSLTTTKSPTTLSNFSYTYDALGNRLSTTDTSGAHAYTYDALSQLTQATNPTIPYAYDSSGNRTSSGGISYTTNSLNQYASVGATTHTYDAAGNLTSDGTATYTWDFENRLTSVERIADSVEYAYDPFGRRSTKTVDGLTTHFLYDGANLLAETDAAGNISALYLHGPKIDEPLEMKRDTTTSYYSHDGLGSVVHLTDAAGSIVERYAYDPYGTPTITNASGTILSASAIGNPFLFTAREWDSETGLYFYRARYYSPKLGRFLSYDPLGQIPDVNLYRFVGNNPLNFIDPLGLSRERTMRAPWWVEGPASMLWEPADWFLTGRDWLQGDFRWLDVPGLLPGLSHGMVRGVGNVHDVVKSSFRSADTWSKPNKLQRHFLDHGTDFGAKSADDYAQGASEFLQRSQRQRLPTKIDSDGTIRVYDPASNTLGAYSPDGTTKTLFKPSSPTYWDRQPGSPPWVPGLDE